MANTRQEIIDELKALLEQNGSAIKEQVDHLKTQFYTIADDVEEQVNQHEEQFKELLAISGKLQEIIDRKVIVGTTESRDIPKHLKSITQ